MYEELRLRAQTFEVLTGGDFAADHADGLDSEASAEGKELGLSVIPLPPDLISDLRVTLHVSPAPEPPRLDFPSAGAGRSQVPHDSKEVPRV